nr:SDR family oxidoreductase [Herbaspirillum sp. ASV7]
MILVTGATGFVGRALVRRLVIDTSPANLLAAVRRLDANLPDGVGCVQIGDLLPTTDWRLALQDAHEVIHCAARVHVMNDQTSDPLSEFRRVNVEGTANLARQAAAAGVKRFIFLSSIKVNGEHTLAGQAFTADDAVAPTDPYGISKHEAEQLLRQIGTQTGMEIVIIRPPLVYGPGVKANFASMMRWLTRGVPLPLAAITGNRRSLVALDTLVDLIVTCLDHPAAANQTFLVSDGEDLSTAGLLIRMSVALGRPARLIHCPPVLLRLGAAMMNRSGIYQRLCGSLQLDITKTRELLGWNPPVSVDEGLRRTIEGFHQ